MPAHVDSGVHQSPITLAKVNLPPEPDDRPSVAPVAAKGNGRHDGAPRSKIAAGGVPGGEEALLAAIRKALAEQYARGRADAVADIVRAAQGVAPKEPEPKSRPGGGNGRARALIDRVLAAGGSSLTPRQIFESDANADRSVSLDGVRQALKAGRKRGAYCSDLGHWAAV